MEMSKRLTSLPKIEAEEIHKKIMEKERFLIYNFFDLHRAPDNITEEDYMRDSVEEYYKLKVKRLKMLERRR